MSIKFIWRDSEGSVPFAKDSYLQNIWLDGTYGSHREALDDLESFLAQAGFYENRLTLQYLVSAD